MNLDGRMAAYSVDRGVVVVPRRLALAQLEPLARRGKPENLSAISRPARKPARQSQRRTHDRPDPACWQTLNAS